MRGFLLSHLVCCYPYAGGGEGVSFIRSFMLLSIYRCPYAGGGEGFPFIKSFVLLSICRWR